MKLPHKPATRLFLTFSMFALMQCCCCVIPVRWRLQSPVSSSSAPVISLDAVYAVLRGNVAVEPSGNQEISPSREPGQNPVETSFFGSDVDLAELAPGGGKAVQGGRAPQRALKPAR